MHELQAASNHLYYEIMMLSATSRALALGISGKSILTNALLESFVIHARSLLYFLYDTNPKPDDVVADDFFPDQREWHKARPAKSTILATVHRRVGKEVAHLTYARQLVTAEMKNWDFVAIGDEIIRSCNVFTGLVSKECLGDRWKGNVPEETNPYKASPGQGQR